jgi:hypothetical protein
MARTATSTPIGLVGMVLGSFLALYWHYPYKTYTPLSRSWSSILVLAYRFNPDVIQLWQQELAILPPITQSIRSSRKPRIPYQKSTSSPRNSPNKPLSRVSVELSQPDILLAATCPIYPSTSDPQVSPKPTPSRHEIQSCKSCLLIQCIHTSSQTSTPKQ